MPPRSWGLVQAKRRGPEDGHGGVVLGFEETLA